MRGYKSLSVILAISILLAGCSAWTATKGLFVSGVSLEALGDQFVAVSTQVTSGCEQQVIPRVTCDRYRAFGAHFKRVYPLTVEMWRAAKKAQDTESQSRAEDVARSLSRDLSGFAVEALGSFAPGGK